MSKKQELLDYITNPKTTTSRNLMGCDENWYNPYYAISQTFTLEEINIMKEEEIGRLFKLASEISEALY